MLRGDTNGDAVRQLERVAIALAPLVLAFGLIAAFSGFFAGRDQPGVSGSQAEPGQVFRDLGHAHLQETNPDPSTTPARQPAVRTSRSRYVNKALR